MEPWSTVGATTRGAVSGIDQICCKPAVESDKPRSLFFGCASPMSPGTCKRIKLVDKPEMLGVTTTALAPVWPVKVNTELTANLLVAGLMAMENRNPLPF